MKPLLLTTTLLPLTTLAHFQLSYPTWRADSLSESNESISQWTYPCANVQTGQNTSQARTPWPLDGGSLLLELHHDWTYLFVNLGFGSEVTNFNVSLNPDGGKLVNETGNGTFCWDRLSVPSAQELGLEVTEGLEASIQVVTVGDSGSALYNCADIVFTSNAALLPSEECFNSTGLTATTLEGSAQSSNTTSGTDHSASASSSSSTGAAVSLRTNILLLALLAAGAGILAL